MNIEETNTLKSFFPPGITLTKKSISNMLPLNSKVGYTDITIALSTFSILNLHLNILKPIMVTTVA